MAYTPPTDDICAVCHDNFRLPCQANCSHWFCGDCILRVWRHTSALQPCKCPICRRVVTLLIPSESTTRQRHEPQVSQVLEDVQRYNRLFGGDSVSLLQRIRDMPLLIRRLLRELMDPQRSLPLVFRARIFISMFVSVLYVLSPIDILPEAILGVIGLLDDALIVLVVLLHLAAMYRSALLYRHGGSY
ncbi:E3 ubiquitin-protein ligase RNF170 [Amborella trichopoda]|uniref:E3 ubiquitin-protein ligase RNF170 n=1 Tax=Amborella trichopoda TaxID=13333 RepID=U5DCR7_AMBTC|nr:E3 ubiquitin-protein ligase RNF170 [Amborella trichopoda]ERN18198.1 hypothetical protein AMTR_s00054p00206420 [Amborella trichopoda]|eukprot:XP_006856731.1 E3 ubiquitin-protein ligase RNF170 [Amborella trichopoda]